MTSVTATRLPWAVSPDRLRRVKRRHPEWGVWLAAAAAWTLVVALDASSPPTHGAPGAHLHHGWLVTQAGWLLMVVAMMVPTSIPAVRRVAFDSLPRRRSRAMSVWLAGYVAVWAAFGSVATTVAVVGGHARWTLGGVLVVAAAYELTAGKRRALRACHLTVPLPPSGRKADVACARAGVRHGTACLASCWALMLAMAVAGHGSLVLMVFLAVVVLAQRWLVVGTRLGPYVAAALVVAAIVPTI